MGSDPSLEKGPNLSRLGLQHLGKGRKIGDFSTAILSKISRPRARHSVKGSSPDPVHTFRAQPITRYLPTKVHSYMYYKKVP